jgi:small subunit ribosomal protein S14
LAAAAAGKKTRIKKHAIKIMRFDSWFVCVAPPGFLTKIPSLGLHRSAQRVFTAPRIMAKKSWIARNERKARTVAKYSDLRHKLKAEKDYIGLTMLPRDASPTRLVNRCEYSGRRRAFLRRFRLSRISFRELASHGMIPGVTKSSW